MYENLVKPIRIKDNVFFEDHRGQFVNSKISDGFVLRQVSSAVNPELGTFRGFHWQTRIVPDIKIVRVISGEVLDIIINIDKFSPLFGSVYQFKLSPDSSALIVPACCAHGYLTLTKDAALIYAHTGEFNQYAQMRMSPFKCRLPEEFLKQISVISNEDSQGVSLEQAYF